MSPSPWERSEACVRGRPVCPRRCCSRGQVRPMCVHLPSALDRDCTPAAGRTAHTPPTRVDFREFSAWVISHSIPSAVYRVTSSHPRNNPCFH